MIFTTNIRIKPNLYFEKICTNSIKTAEFSACSITPNELNIPVVTFHCTITNKINVFETIGLWKL